MEVGPISYTNQRPGLLKRNVAFPVLFLGVLRAFLCGDSCRRSAAGIGNITMPSSSSGTSIGSADLADLAFPLLGVSGVVS